MSAEIFLGVDIAHHIGKPIEVLIYHTHGRGRSTEYRTTESSIGILEGTYDKWVNDEAKATIIMLTGGGGMATGRRLEIKWDDATLDSVKYELWEPQS